MTSTNEEHRCDPDCPRKESGTCYAHHKCRCDICKAANARRCAKRRKQRDPSTLPVEAHGKPATYSNWNCRCDLCTEAWGAAQTARYRDNDEFRETQKAYARAYYHANKGKS